MVSGHGALGAGRAIGIYFASDNRSHRSVVVPCDGRTRHHATGDRSVSATLDHRCQSGLPLEVQLTYFHDGSDPILLASNYGGTKHPHWYYNLKAHPECEFGGEKFVATEVTDPDEHTRLYALAEGVYAGYGDYRAKTSSVGRQIPIFRLKPR